MVVLGLIFVWREWLARSEARRIKPIRARVIFVDREESGSKSYAWFVETHYDVPGHGEIVILATEWRSPALAGLFGSRPVSRILSRVTISLGGVPGSSAGRVNGACFTLHRTGFGEPAVSPRPLVGSYPTVSPLPASVSLHRRSPFCSTFRRLSPPGSPQRPCPAVSGLSSSPRRARGHPACTADGNASWATRSSDSARIVLHSGHASAPRTWRTNSPHTRHSRLAPRSSAASSWSRDRFSGATVTRGS